MSTARALIAAVSLTPACAPASSATDDASDASDSSESGAAGSDGDTSEAEPTASTTTSGSSTTASADDTTTGGDDASSTGPAGDDGSTGAPPLPECPTFAAGVAAGALVDPAIEEASGLVASRQQPGVLWLHNDSGDSPRVFAIDETGATLVEVAIDDATALDWEDMALGPGPEVGVDHLYLGDIGDNAEQRPFVTIHRIPEPEVPDRGGVVSISGSVALDVQYPDRPHNAETLLSDPLTGLLYIVTKESRGPSQVFLVDPDAGSSPIAAEPLGELAFGSAELPGNDLATAGDVSPNGELVVVRTYGSAFAWRRPAGAALAAAFETEPCPLPLAVRVQGETIAFASTGDAYFTISEGAAATVWRFDLAR